MLVAEVGGKRVARSYTPVSDNKNNTFDLLVKVYMKNDHFPVGDTRRNGGLLSQHLDRMDIGDQIDVKGCL